MKKEIHPAYHKDAHIKCACGSELRVGYTLRELKVDVCSNCHPFYTGQDRILDIEGRVEKFNRKFNIKK